MYRSNLVSQCLMTLDGVAQTNGKCKCFAKTCLTPRRGQDMAANKSDF